MPSVVGSITSVSWWFFTVCLMSVAMNLAAAYAKPWVDRVGSRLFAGYRDRTLAAKKKRTAEVELLSHSEMQQVLHAININRLHLHAIRNLVLCTALLMMCVLLTIMAILGDAESHIKLDRGTRVEFLLAFTSACFVLLVAVGYHVTSESKEDALRKAKPPDSGTQDETAPTTDVKGPAPTSNGAQG